MGLLDDGQYEPSDKYLAPAATSGSALSLPEEIVHGAVATVADIGTTYWNSLTPKAYNASTADLLSRIDGDALQVYNEHPDAIRTLSFIGGTVLPIGLSIKGMNMLRAGTKGLSWFSKGGQAAQLSAVETAFANAGRDSIFQAAKWSMYRGMAYNAIADNVAMEAAIVGTLSAHPFMEDYYKDFGSNFLRSVAIGTGIQGVVGGILTKTAINKVTGAIEAVPTKMFKEAIVDPMREAGISPISHLGQTAQIHIQGIEKLEGQIAAATAGTLDLPDWTVRLLKSMVAEQRSIVVNSIKEAAQGDLRSFLEKGADADAIKYITDFVAKEGNMGLDKIAFAEAQKLTGALEKKVASQQLKESTSLVQKVINKLTGKEEIVKTDAIYLPWAHQGEGAYIGREEASLYLTAADLGQTIQQLEAKMGKNFGQHIRQDWSVEMPALPTSQLDGEFIGAVLAIGKKSAKEINAMEVHPEDLPVLKALHTRIHQLLREDPSLVFNIKVAKAPPSWNAQVIGALAQRGGVSASYVTDMETVSKTLQNMSNYSPAGGNIGGLSAEAFTELNMWIGGSYDYLRAGASYYKDLIKDFAYRFDHATQTWFRGASNIIKELYESPRSVAARAELLKIADVDGNLWLYRGLTREPTAHRSLESYSFIPEKAAEFAKSNPKAVKLFKVNVNDVVTVMNDVGPDHRRLEVLAFPPVRDWHQISKSNLRQIPDELLIQPAQTVNIANREVATLTNPTQLEQILVDAQKTAVDTLRAKNFGVETIALKTGTPLETVEKILAEGRVDGAGLIKYSSKEDAELAIGFKNRALALSTNMKKVAQPGLRSALDAQNLEETSSGLVEFYLLSSPSEIVQRLGRELLSDDVKTLVSHFADGLQDILSSKMKSTLWTSTNQALSAMGPVGVIANAIGKKVIHVKNEMTKLFEEPIANLFGQVIKAGEAELIEFNTSAAVNASIKGRRFYKDGAFWIPSTEMGLQDFRQFMKMDTEQFKLLLAAKPDLFQKAQYAGKDYNIASPIVRELHERLQAYGREMYEFTNSRMKALGKQDLTDIGYWTPSYNPRNKALAYVYDQVDKTVSMLYADSDELLATGIQQYEKAMLAAKGPDFMANLKIVTKKDQAFFNDLAGRHDPLYMQAADITKQHGGASTPTIVSTDTSVMKDILQGYQSQVHRGIEGIVELQLNQSMNMLKGISQVSTGVNTPATYSTIKAAISKPVDVGQTIRNILLGRPLLNQHSAWSELQQYTQVGTDMALKVITEAFQPLLAPVIGKMSGVKVRSMEEWTNVLKQMESKGIVNPFESLDKAFGLGRYMQEGKSGTDALTPRGIALGNGLAASLLLRIGDLAQPFVNAVSLPILTSAAMRRQFSSSFMGATLDPNAKFALAKTMYDGFRFSQHPSFKPWLERGAANGYFSMDIREITELMAHQRSLDPGVITATEQFLEKFSNTPGNTSILRYLTKPADISEEFVRVQSYATGILMAKKAYPGISDIGANTFARDFMDQVVGNYTAAQRPALFQGTFGMAMGLFQTYMLTMAQTIYRQVEHRDWASLGKLLLTQSTIFGASSLPGFHNVSSAIATHFSDQHFDLESGTFRALPNPVANVLLYGMPSSFGPGIVTRGDIQPRIPNPMQGFQSLALVNITTQAYQGMERVASAAFQADQSTGRAMLEAISLQSVSRPLARLSELAMGQAITSKGDLVADSTSLYTTQGIISRVMATRPLKEIKAREVLHLNTLYNAADTEKRHQVIGRLKTMIRSGSLDDEKLGELADNYLRTGTTTGWRSAVNDAIKQEAGGADYVTLNKLKKDSPLKSMLEDIGP